MSISGMMRTSASGMAAQSSRLGTVSDNIANASTHGYKRAFTEFSTVVLESGTGTYVPGSVDTQIRYGITQQGGFDYTTSATDLAVSGEGFFLVGDPSGSTYLTRAGSFVKIANGDLVNAAGYTLQGYPLNGGTAAVSANGTTGLQNVNIGAMSLEATPSTTGKFYVNLQEDADIQTDTPAGNAATAVYTSKTSMTVVDNVGREKTLDIYYTKTAANEWEIAVYDASEAASAGAPFPYASGPINANNEVLIFDPLTGQSAKLEQLLGDMAEVAENNRKAIIFSQWVEPLEVLARALADYGPLLYHGRVPHPERQAILEAGGSRPAMESFKAFRGREPTLDALLRHQGMA